MTYQVAGKPEIAELHAAFEVFTAATASLEREYQLLREQAEELRRQLAEKHVALMTSLERQRRLELQTLRQSKLAAMGEMAATLAHEVRNPLGGMELCTGLLIDELREQPSGRRLAEQIARGIQDLNHLVGNMLEYGQLREPVFAQVSVDALIDDSLAMIGPALETGVAIERVGGRDVHWRIDRGLLTQVLLNLVRNAGQAMGDRGTLRIEVGADARELCIVVADSGPGIPASERETIFDSFFTTKQRGTGLGLAVARAAVLAHAGTLALEPSSEGARFVIRIPVRRPDAGESR
ncbi:MAG: hypothetical protein FJ144_14590 [Deltaproteobacteria bacterium]|nr:hypothetical protein [Deltaproteobacteria bacterium]